MSSRIFRSVALAFLIVPALSAPASAFRVMCYNLLNYSSGRYTEFTTVLQGIQPDVMVSEETLSQSAVDAFLANVLNVVNPAEWAAGEFVDGPDTDNAFFYRTTAVTYVGHYVIGTSLRDIDEYTFRPATHTSSDANVRIYVVHLKASSGSSNEAQRLAEVTTMRARMETFPAGQSYMVAGDYNIYADTETPYQYMINPANGAAGVVEDPIQREGNWHINPSFADIHTQSPRVTSFGGGATGGLDDRFDMILTSPALRDGEGIDILPSTYAAFGQDGQHFDGALNVAPYVVVDSTTAEAIHDASDHLPVFADFQGPSLLVTDPSVAIGTAIVGGTAAADLSVGNGAPLPGDDLDYSLAAPGGFTAPAGSFSVAAGAPAALHSIGMDTSTSGAKSGDLVVTSDDPDAPAELVPLTGTVLDHAQPSVDGGSLLTGTTLDLGVVAAGDTAGAAADAYDYGYGSLQALLDVYDFALSGDPGFFLDGGFTPATVGATPASFDVAFDATGASTGTHTGTLTLHARDQQDLSGAVSLADLTYDLTVVVGSPPVEAVVTPASPDRSGFVAVQPNPFRPSTTLRFAVKESASVSLRVYDVRGSLVRTLQDGQLAPGFHAREWNGRDQAGRSVSPGIYFARLVANGTVETRKVVKVR